MRVANCSIFKLNIPFVETFSHSSKSRNFSDSYLVRLQLDSGHIGYGEGVARPYVTGETVDSATEYIKCHAFPEILKQEIGILGLNMARALPNPRQGEVVFHSAHAALEMAALDAILQAEQKGLQDLLPPKVKRLKYSGVITATNPENVTKITKKLRIFGITDFKLKVNAEDAIHQIDAARNAIGQDCTLRIDANCAFTPELLLELTYQCRDKGIVSIEQPFQRMPAKELAQIKKQMSIPLVVDESLLTEEDAQELIEHKACDVFNLRIAKCGGIARVLRLAEMARCAGIGYQLGCQVGETCLLSAVGRHLAAHLGDCLFVEGSFGALLLTEDLSRNRIQFGHGGFAPILRGTGLGVDILPEKIEKYLVSTVEL